MSPLRTALRAAADAIADAVESVVQQPAVSVEWLPLAACNRYGLTVRQLRRLIAAGELRASRSGRRMLLRSADVEAWLAARSVVACTASVPRVETKTEPVDAVGKLIEHELQRGRLRVVKGTK